MKRTNRVLPESLFPLNSLTVVVGHYGSGKTNFSLNLAYDAASQGSQVTLIDLDVVNPYFRSSDYRGDLAEKGIEIISPVFAGTTLDNPSLSGRINAVLQQGIQGSKGVDGDFTGNLTDSLADNHVVIIDAGGDDVGATALGRFAPEINAQPHEVYYVINKYRNLTQEAHQAVEVLYAIEEKSHLRATGVVNNSHLQEETTTETIQGAQEFAKEVAEDLKIPLVCTTVPNMLAELKSVQDTFENVYPVNRYVRTSWDLSSKHSS